MRPLRAAFRGVLFRFWDYPRSGAAENLDNGAAPAGGLPGGFPAVGFRGAAPNNSGPNTKRAVTESPGNKTPICE